jgi:hypothetical protein
MNYFRSKGCKVCSLIGLLQCDMGLDADDAGASGHRGAFMNAEESRCYLYTRRPAFVARNQALK